MYTKCLHCNCQLKNSVYNIYNMRLVITIERLPCFVGDKQTIINKKSKKHYTFLHKSCIILNIKHLHNV